MRSSWHLWVKWWDAKEIRKHRNRIHICHVTAKASGQALYCEGGIYGNIGRIVLSWVLEADSGLSYFDSGLLFGTREQLNEGTRNTHIGISCAANAL
jgi:hypothetical protein